MPSQVVGGGISRDVRPFRAEHPALEFLLLGGASCDRVFSSGRKGRICGAVGGQDFENISQAERSRPLVVIVVPSHAGQGGVSGVENSPCLENAAEANASAG